MAAFSLGVGGECAPGAGAVLAFDAGIGEAEADDPFVVLQQRSRLAAALAARVGDLAAADVWEWFDGVVGDPVITLLDAGSRPDHPSWEPHLAALWEERRVAWVAMEAAWLATQAPVLALRQWQGCAAVERAFGAWRTAVSPRIAVASAAVEWRSCARVELAFSAWRSAAQLHQLRLQAEADRSRLGFSSEELRAAEAELARRSTESILLGPGRVRACTREELCALELAARCAAQRRASAAAASARRSALRAEALRASERAAVRRASAQACAVADHVLANGWSLLLSVETVRSMKIPYWTPSLPYKLLLALRLLSLALYARSQRLHLHNPSPPR
jgi:hypothetical protein